MAMKCGNCQRNTIAKEVYASREQNVIKVDHSLFAAFGAGRSG
jgi:hypothetical protein